MLKESVFLCICVSFLTYIVALFSADVACIAANIVAMFPLFIANALQLFQWPKEKSRYLRIDEFSTTVLILKD